MRGNRISRISRQHQLTTVIPHKIISKERIRTIQNEENMSDSKKWLTISEASAAARITKEEARRRAKRIHANAQYTIMGCSLASLQKMRRNGYGIVGLTPVEAESLPILTG